MMSLFISLFNIPRLVLEWIVESKQADKETGRWPTKWGGKNEVQNEIKTRSEWDQTPPRQDTQPAAAVLDKY